jgi:DnaJ-class molecular chaperone
MSRPRYPTSRINKNLPPSVPPNKRNLVPPSHYKKNSTSRPPQTHRSVVLGVCPNCNGSGSSGWLNLGTCGACSGSGKYIRACRILRKDNCPICNGSGSSGWLNLRTCEACSGSGMVDVVECKRCSGPEPSCPICSGSGAFWVSCSVRFQRK